MLKHLEIKNYALIDEVTLDFSRGFTTITGETGAGKSIMLGALSLLCGARAESKGAKASPNASGKTIVEAVFANVDLDLRAAIEGADAEWFENDECILRREISPNGRSRAFVNDTPVNLQQLAEIGGLLIDIHSQHHNTLLCSPEYQLSIIDALADNTEKRERYKDTFKRYVNLRRALQTKLDAIAKAKEEREFFQFRLENLNKLNPQKGEWEELSKIHDILSDAGDINERLNEGAYLLGGADTSVLARLTEARDSLRKIDFSLFEAKTNDAPSVLQRIENLLIEAKDIYETVADLSQSIESDPARLEKVDARLDALHEAVKRYKVVDADSLVELHQSLKEQLRLIDGSDEDVERMEKEYKQLRVVLKEQADELSATRVNAAEKFSDQLTELARPLGLQNLRFSAMVNKGKLTIDGQDNVEFLCSFNKNQELMPMQKVASGGEMARLMLCIKDITSLKMNLATMIFDEVDTGVSGDIADRMGKMMAKMGERTQVIAITHLPQVASRGAEQFRVYKADNEERTLSHVVKLTFSEREIEIAKMLAGADITAEAIANAKALLKGRG